MTNAIIKVENLSKKYILGKQQQKRYDSLRDVITENYKSFTQRIFRSQQELEVQASQEFLAIDDISFEVKQGEVIGIIGRNGAGKSTLLKILSRITEPTKGKITINGRVASLLEVGTGFHPELTGRENIFLNGAILGMGKVEINRNFDEIVAFAEIEKFIDTPVKRYSSGMYVRLAFAVAAHLEPEILIVDEVLAVGDASFQKKCLGKMQDVSAKEGRTVLFVSHNLQAVQDLCSVGIVLEKGKVLKSGNINEVIESYMNLWKTGEIGSDLNLQDRMKRCSGEARFININVKDSQDFTTWEVQEGSDLKICITYQVFKAIPNLMIYIAFNSLISGRIITACKHTISEAELLPNGMKSVVVSLPKLCLRPNTYSLYCVLGSTSNPYTPYDVLDNNVNLPFISITSDESDPHKRAGYFSIVSSLSEQE